MTETERQKMLTKVRKLLALASSSNENEAAAAAEKAQALLAEYNLTMSDVDTGEDEDTKFEIDGELSTESYPWRRSLANMVAMLYFCTYFYTTHKYPVRKDHHSFVGAKHNIEVAKMMFSYLNETVDRLAKQGALKVPQEERSAYRTSFRSACTLRLCRRIQQRIDDAKRGGEIKTESGNTLPALASLYDSTKNQLDKFLQKEVGEMKVKKTSLARPSLLGELDGAKAGNEIGLDQQVGQKSNLRLGK